MPDAQTKPTAADVLREHYAIERHPFGRPAYRQCACGWADDMNRRGFPQHQADMLAAAGLLATAGPFPCCRHCVEDAIHDVEPNRHDAECQRCALSEHDAHVAAEALREAGEEVGSGNDPYRPASATARDLLRWADEIEARAARIAAGDPT